MNKILLYFCAMCGVEHFWVNNNERKRREFKTLTTQQTVEVEEK